MSGRSIARRESPSTIAADRRPVHRRLAPEGPQQPLRHEVVEHLARVDGVDRREADRHVADRFGDDPADAHQHGGPELGIAHHPGDQLAGARHHGGDQHRHVAVGGGRGGQQRLGRRSQRVGVAETQAHQASFGLVGDAVAAELGRHGVAQFFAGDTGRRSVSDESVGHHWDVVVGQERLGRRLRERGRRWDLTFGHGGGA